MPGTVQKTAWGTRGGSARGASHLRSGLPNQDSLGAWSGESGGRAVVVVSDGHGSARHFRSDTGSRLGVDAAMSVLRGMALPIGEAEARALGRPIVETWREHVKSHLAEHPFAAADWEHVPDAEREDVEAAVADNPVVAYGATLLAVLAAGPDLLFLQLGDGDILCVADDGATTRPMTEDSRLIANQTTSLCQNEAPENFRYAQIHADGPSLPKLILLSSDGYSNSFTSDDDFLQVGADYLKLMLQFGAEKVEAQLEHILSEASRKGSGDDITLGILERLGDAVEVPAPEPAVASQRSKPTSELRPKDVGTAPAPPVTSRSKPASGLRSKDIGTAPAPAATSRSKPRSALQPQALDGGTAPEPVGTSQSRPGSALQPQALDGGTAPRLQSVLHKYKVPLVALILLAAAGIALAYWRPPAIAALFRSAARRRGPALRLPGGEQVPLKAGTVLSAAQLRLEPPFDGPVLEVASSEKGLILRNRSGREWSAAGPDGADARKIGIHDSIPARNGERVILGAVQLVVVSD